MHSGANSNSLLSGIARGSGAWQKVLGLEVGGQAREEAWPCFSSVNSGSCTFQWWLAQIWAQIPQLGGEQQIWAGLERTLKIILFHPCLFLLSQVASAWPWTLQGAWTSKIAQGNLLQCLPTEDRRSAQLPWGPGLGVGKAGE